MVRLRVVAGLECGSVLFGRYLVPGYHLTVEGDRYEASSRAHLLRIALDIYLCPKNWCGALVAYLAPAVVCVAVVLRKDQREASSRLCLNRFLRLHCAGTVGGLKPATPKGSRNGFRNYAPDKLRINVDCL